MTTNHPDGRKHILVVNDDPAILQLFDELLSEEGYRVTLDNFSRQTQEVYEGIREHRPDLVILDFIIGNEGGGWQLLQVLEMDRTTRDTPLIICTGAVRQVTELSGHLETMGIQVVLKPFDIDHLLSVVKSML
jgi:DNA-binding response OmpR family regulator